MSKGKTLAEKLRFGLRVARQLLVELLAPDEPPEPPEPPEPAPTVETAPVTPIAELRSGQLAKVVGKVRCFDDPKLFAPLSGRRCAFYRTRLLEADEQNVLEECGSQSFFVQDESGELLVVVKQAEVAVAMDAEVKWGLFDKLEPSAKEFLDRHGRESHDAVFRRDIQFEEGLIESGETVAVFGQVRPARGGADRFSGYRAARTLMVIEAPPDSQLHITDVLDSPAKGSDA